MLAFSLAAVLFSITGLKPQTAYVPDVPGLVMCPTLAPWLYLALTFRADLGSAASAREFRNTFVNDWKFIDRNVVVREVRTEEDPQYQE
jgi:hypothetical protein